MTTEDTPAVDPTALEDFQFDPREQRFRGYTVHGNKSFDVPFISEIAPNLWQGGCRNGLILPDFFKHLVSLYVWEAYTVNHVLQTALSVVMYDSQDQATEQVLDIASWVNSCRNSGPVLVHCQGGLNRSSLVTGAALVMNDEATGPEAIDILRERRSPACLCNTAFEKWLRELKFEDSIEKAKDSRSHGDE